MQDRIRLVLMSATQPHISDTTDFIWLSLPFDAMQLKTELQKILFARLQQSVA